MGKAGLRLGKVVAAQGVSRRVMPGSSRMPQTTVRSADKMGRPVGFEGQSDGSWVTAIDSVAPMVASTWSAITPSVGETHPPEVGVPFSNIQIS